MTPINASVVFGVDVNKARPDYTLLECVFDPLLKGYLGRKQAVKIRGELCTVELFVTRQLAQPAVPNPSQTDLFNETQATR